MWYVAPSFKGKKFLKDPYLKNGKYYTQIEGANGKPREIRVYEEWQNAWPESQKPWVERLPDRFLAHNYPAGRYADIIGIRTVDGRTGFWKYTKLPDKIYDWQDNVVLSPLFGYVGWLHREPVWELKPEFIDIKDVEVPEGFRRLITDDWYSKELERYHEMAEAHNDSVLS